MNPIDYHKWLERTDEEKIFTITVLASWFVIIYYYETNVLILKRFKTASKRSDEKKKQYEAVLDIHSNKDKPPLFAVPDDVIQFEQDNGDQNIVKQCESSEFNVTRFGKSSYHFAWTDFQWKILHRKSVTTF